MNASDDSNFMDDKDDFENKVENDVSDNIDDEDYDEEDERKKIKLN